MSAIGVSRQLCGRLRPIVQHCRSSGELIFTPRLMHRSCVIRTAEGDKNTEEIQESAEVTELKNSLKELETTSAEWKSKHDDILDKYRRSIAESDNMRKRLTKQIEEAKIFGIQGFGKDLLEVADVLDKAVGMGVESQSVEDLHQGLKMTQAQLLQVFKRHGLETIDPLNEKFDPNKHDALFQIPDPDKEPNTVVNVQKVGYSLLDGRFVQLLWVFLGSNNNKLRNSKLYTYIQKISL